MPLPDTSPAVVDASLDSPPAVDLGPPQPDASTAIDTGGPAATAMVVAFPGAEGYGAQSVGGRAGKVIEVTNLDDDGPGSLRACAEDPDPRTCVFRVAGHIVLDSKIRITNSRITIAGQTAPGDGITIRRSASFGGSSGSPLEIRGATDVIVRYLTFRVGQTTADNPGSLPTVNGEEGVDNITVRSGDRIIFDHLSAEWASDENISTTPNCTGCAVTNLSVQWCIIAENLAPHSTGSTNSRYGETDRIVDRLSYHHNLWAHSNHRNPRIASHASVLSGIRSQIINNVVYNWQHRVGETKGAARTDFYGNYWIQGPMSNAHNVYLHEHMDGSTVLPDPSLYVENNIVVPTSTVAAADNWPLITFSYSGNGYSSGDTLPLAWRRANPHLGGDAPAIAVSLHAPATAYQRIVVERRVGNTARLDKNGNFVSRVDPVDAALFLDVINGTGPNNDEQMDHQDDFGGYPAVNAGTAYPDNDHDGMSDSWEMAHGLDPNDTGDGAEDADGDGYTNLEEFLNGTNPGQ